MDVLVETVRNGVTVLSIIVSVIGTAIFVLAGSAAIIMAFLLCKIVMYIDNKRK